MRNCMTVRHAGKTSLNHRLWKNIWELTELRSRMIVQYARNSSLNHRLWNGIWGSILSILVTDRTIVRRAGKSSLNYRIKTSWENSYHQKLVEKINNQQYQKWQRVFQFRMLLAASFLSMKLFCDSNWTRIGNFYCMQDWY